MPHNKVKRVLYITKEKFWFVLAAGQLALVVASQEKRMVCSYPYPNSNLYLNPYPKTYTNPYTKPNPYPYP